MPTLSLLSTGSNARGQLASGDLEDAHTFTPTLFVDTPPGALPPATLTIDDIALGANHTLILLCTSSGTELWGCGDGSRGQLGPLPSTPTSFNSSTFRRLDTELGLEARWPGYAVRLIASGWETSYLVLLCSGESDVLVSFGADDFGNLGVGRTAPKSLIHVVDLLAALSLSSNSEEDAILTVRSISTGPHHVVVHVSVHKHGSEGQHHLVGWGAARHGQLGALLSPNSRPLTSTPFPRLLDLPLAPSPPLNPHISSIAVGSQHTVLVHSSGAITAAGTNRKCQLAGLDAASGIIAVDCTWNGTYTLNRAGEVLTTGSNTHGQLGRGPLSKSVLTAIPRFTDGRITKIVCGSEHVLCLISLDEGGEGRTEVWGWGWNEHGNLGRGDMEDAWTPIRIWPSGDQVRGRVRDVWAGCGTSWILVEQ